MHAKLTIMQWLSKRMAALLNVYYRKSAALGLIQSGEALSI